MEDILIDQANVLNDLARQRLKEAKRCRDEAAVLRSLAAELLAVADAVQGGTGASQAYHPNVTEQIDVAPPMGVHLVQQDTTSNNGQVLSPRSIYHLRVDMNQSAQISKAAREAADGKIVGLRYPDGSMIVLTPENFDKIAIPHATEAQEHGENV